MATAPGVKLFEKKVSEVDIRNGLVLEPDQSNLIHLPQFDAKNGYVDFYVMDEERMAWHFRCYTGCSVGGVLRKPVILEGWGEFVRHYGLKAKDKVILYDNGGESNGGVPFVIHVRRTIRLFGVDITQAD